MDKEQLKLEAERLVNDQTLRIALQNMRSDALERLVTANPDDMTDVLRFQMKVAAIDGLLSELAAMIQSAAPIQKHVAI